LGTRAPEWSLSFHCLVPSIGRLPSREIHTVRRTAYVPSQSKSRRYLLRSKYQSFSSHCLSSTVLGPPKTECASVSSLPRLCELVTNSTICDSPHHLLFLQSDSGTLLTLRLCGRFVEGRCFVPYCRVRGPFLVDISSWPTAQAGCKIRVPALESATAQCPRPVLRPYHGPYRGLCTTTLLRKSRLPFCVLVGYFRVLCLVRSGH
jgi:hypothetical protein